MALRHRINRGQGASIKTGIDFAVVRDYEVAIFFDADGQMDPTEIKLFLNKIASGYEVVLGSRNLGRSRGMPKLKKIIKQIALIFTNFTTGLKLSDTHNGFQAWTINALKKIRLDQDRMAYASQVVNEISRLKLNYAEIPVTINYTAYSKQKGQSLWNVFGILWDLLIK
jgi:glycosyltransferase involved in cell wall biosynthesis